MQKVIIRMWGESFLLALVVATGWAYYISQQGVSPGSYSGVSQVFAGTGTVLFGLSFLLSPICYFYDFFDRKIAYRKQLGLLGYLAALIYSILLMFSDLEFYFYGFFTNFFSADIFFGVSAMAIFSVMALISNITMMKKLGAKRWRDILRLGYIAYAFLVMRAIWIEWDLWSAWAETMNGLPPIRIPLCIFATIVIVMRIVVTLHASCNAKREE